MKFLADENISNKVVDRLRNKAVDIVSIKELVSGLSDEAVFKRPQTRKIGC